jgi:hypothetical protein
VNIDDALREYVSRPVPLGMEERILIRCRPTTWWRWPVLALAACALTVLVWIRPVEHSRRLVARPSAAGENAYATAAAPPAERRVRRRRKPDPARALWRFAQQHPEAAAALTTEYEPVPVVPLTIEPIAIEELGDLK